MALEDRVSAIFHNYSTPSDLTRLTPDKQKELARYSIGRVFGKDEDAKGHMILQDIGRYALNYLFPAIENKPLGEGESIEDQKELISGFIDDIIKIAAKGRAARNTAARFSIGALRNLRQRDNVKPIILQTAIDAARYLTYALDDDSICTYAEEMLRAIDSDSGYERLVTEELKRAQDPGIHYRPLVRERAAKILASLPNRNL
jgi:hypothetical protein